MADEKQSVAPVANDPSPSQAEAIRILRRVMRRHHVHIDNQISDLGIHHGQYRMLRYLAHCDDNPLSQKELAEARGISPAAVATALKKMEKEGFITRTATDTDSRRNEIHITDIGYAKLVECREVVEAADRAMFDGLSDEELCDLSRLIGRIDANLDAMGVPDPCCQKMNKP